MSCRRSSGNSAVTSYARFHSGADEKTVSREFHALGREERNKLGGKDALTPADQQQVMAFLRGLRDQIRADVNLSDRNRTKLLDRVDTAYEGAKTGKELPNRNIFAAWQRLNDHMSALENALAARPQQAAGEAAVTRTELEAAQGELDALQNQLRHSGHQGRRRMLDAIDKQRKLVRKLQARYDVTADGWAELRYAYRARGGANRELQQRYAAAQDARTTPEYQPTTHVTHTQTRWQQARDAAQAAEDAYRSNPTSKNRETAEAAAAQARNERSQYLRAICEEKRIHLLEHPEQQHSSAAWARTVDLSGDISRKDMWAATEMGLQSQERKAGVSQRDMAKHAEVRAATRQGVLNYEQEAAQTAQSPRQ